MMDTMTRGQGLRFALALGLINLSVTLSPFGVTPLGFFTSGLIGGAALGIVCFTIGRR